MYAYIVVCLKSNKTVTIFSIKVAYIFVLVFHVLLKFNFFLVINFRSGKCK